MKILVISPELIIPSEHKRFDKHLVYRAIDEKYMKRPLEETIANAAAALNELQKIDYVEYRKKYNEIDDNDGWKHVPPVPVVDAPDDLLYLGFFIVYNGHHRLEAARRADMPLPVMLLENDKDIKTIAKFHDDLFFVPNKGAFQRHRDGIWAYARDHLAFGI
ncbi:MAG: hypothetical protein WC852_04530 [Candidatus Nanoarchaeia archaeon]|jgi:hypothetical protein